jgi:glycosyltransferase involved in cell wall biosynthesis
MPPDSSAGHDKLVSIICRSVGRPELKQTLESVAKQSYPALEIVLVEASAESLAGFQKFAGSVSVNFICTGKKLSRSAAANAGLDSVKGDYIMFLDDDDWISENHIANLVDALSTFSDAKAAYSSTQKMSTDGREKKEVFDQEFDSRLLMRDNFIPIHSMLFESALLKSGCRFDESFDVFEDWDFWLQLNRHTNFVHISNLSAFYREGGDSQTASDEDSDRYQNSNLRGQGRVQLFEKWLRIWTGEQLNDLLGFLDQTDEIIGLNSEVYKSQSRVHESNLELASLNTQIQNSDTRVHESNLELANLNTQIQNSDTRVHESNLELANLNTQIQNSNTRVHESNLELANLNTQIQNSNTRVHESNLENSKLHRQLIDADKAIQNSNLQIQQMQGRLEDASKAIEKVIEKAHLEALSKDQQLNSLQRHTASLDSALRTMLDSTSWKIMGPYRRIGRLIKKVAKATQKKHMRDAQAVSVSEEKVHSPDSVAGDHQFTYPLSFTIDRAVIFNNYLFIRGWAIKSPSILSVSAIIDGVSIALNYGSNREDIREAFPLIPGAENSGFHVFVKLDNVSTLDLEFVDAEGAAERKRIKLECLKNPSKLIESGDFIGLDLKSQYEVYRTLQTIAQPDDEEPLREFSYNPLVSIIVPVFNVEKRWLDACVESVLAQTYTKWELCLHDDASTSDETIECLRYWAGKDDRVKVQYGKTNQHISGASNDALKITKGEFIGLMDNDDELHKDALWFVVEALNKDPSIDYLYTDEDKIDANGEFCQPHFKPDWSPELLESMMYVGHFGVIRRSIIDAVGGFRLGVEGSQDFDLTLRISQITQKFTHIPRVLYHWRIIPGSVSGGGNAKNYAYTAAVKALSDHVSKEPQPAKVSTTEHLGLYRIQRESGNPSVTIIMPFHNKAEMTIECLESIALSSYSNFSILVISNNSDDSEFQKVAEFANQHKYIDLQKLNIPFNWSAINNWGIKRCSSEYVLLLNNDMTVISEDWIESLLDCGIKEGVGAVGAKLLYEDDTVQHAGIVMQLGGIAGHAFKHSDARSPGYFGYATVVRNCSAVTGACMLIRRSVALEIGGFNEELSVAYNDVDFCLRLREANYKVLCTPFAKLYHLESKTRPKYLDDMSPKQRSEFETESAYIRKRHAIYFKEGDPYYNKALTLRIEDYSLRV